MGFCDQTLVSWASSLIGAGDSYHKQLSDQEQLSAMSNQKIYIYLPAIKDYNPKVTREQSSILSISIHMDESS